MVEPSIDVFREAALSSWKHRLVRRPGPTAETCPLVVAKCLLDLVASIHHKRTVLRDRLANGASLQKQKAALSSAVLNYGIDIGVQLNGRKAVQRLSADLHGLAAIEIERAVRPF